MPAAYVKPHVRRQKNDAADAAGICEAVTRPSMRFINVRTLANQAVLMHHKTREMLVAQRTQLINALRGHLAEIGVIAAQGLKNARELARLIEMEEDATIPACVRRALAPLVRQLHALDQAIACSYDRRFIDDPLWIGCFAEDDSYLHHRQWRPETMAGPVLLGPGADLRCGAAACGS
jgi:transposase